MAQQNRNAYAYYNYNQNARINNTNSSAAPKIKPAPQKRPALELVKKFDEPKSRAFTNGVLNNIKNLLESQDEE